MGEPAILDSHIHMNDTGGSLLTMLDRKRAAYREAGYSGVCLVCDTAAGIHGLAKNALALLYKRLYPSDTVYVMAGLEYYLPGEEIGLHTFRDQAKALMACGADGFKMYEGKPNARKLIGGRSLLDPSYESFFAWLEQERVPVSIHLADPDDNWDPAKCAEDVFQSGWFFGDSSYAPADTIRREVFEVMRRHPGLRVIIPQLGYLTHTPEVLSEWLERFSELRYDLGPTPEMYRDLSGPRQPLRDLLLRYQDRLLFACTGVCADSDAVVRKGKRHIQTMASVFPREDMLAAIYSGNAEKLFGVPHPVHTERCLEYIERSAECLRRCPERAEPYHSTLARLLEIRSVFRSVPGADGPRTIADAQAQSVR